VCLKKALIPIAIGISGYTVSIKPPPQLQNIFFLTDMYTNLDISKQLNKYSVILLNIMINPYYVCLMLIK